MRYFFIPFSIVLAVLSGLAEASGPRIVEKQFPQSDLLIATVVATEAPFKADASGKTDASTAIQNALIRCYDLGGGAVFLPTGRYRMEKPIVIPETVTLRGDFRAPVGDKLKVEGTILEVYAGHNEESETAFMQLGCGSGVRSLSIFYPRQSVTQVVPYPPTIGPARKGVSKVNGSSVILNPSKRTMPVVMDVNFVNAYQCIVYGPETTNHAFSRRVYGTPLKLGIKLQKAPAVPRFQEIHFSPRFWTESGLDGAPPENDVLQAMQREQSIGFQIVQSDNGIYMDLELDGFFTGMFFGKLPADPEGPVASNGKVFDLRIRRAHVGVDISTIKVQSYTFASGLIEANQGDNPVGVRMELERKLRLGVVFRDIVFRGPQPIFNKIGHVGFLNSTFEMEGGPGSAAVHVEEGYASLLDCKLDSSQPAQAVMLGVNAKGASLHGCSLSGKMRQDPSDLIQITTEEVVLEPLPFRKFPYYPAMFPAKTDPASLYNVQSPSFGAKADGEVDDTASIQQALDQAGRDGGGTVFLPAGMYRIDGHLQVPPGVELRGIHETPVYGFFARTVLLAYVKGDRGKMEGQPFITLEGSKDTTGKIKGAGLRGFSIYYPEQTLLDIVPYPVTVQAKGPNCYVINCMAANAYRGLDFATYQTDGHVIDWYGSYPLHTCVEVGKSSHGWVENMQTNPQYWISLKPEGSVYRTFYNYPGQLFNSKEMRNLDNNPDYKKPDKELKPRIALVLGATQSEVVMGTFFNNAHGGVIARSQDGVGPNAVMINHGLEGDIAFRVDAVGEKGLYNINASSHPLGTEGNHLALGKEIKPHHKVVFSNSINFGVPITGFDIFGGQFIMEGGYMVTGAKEHMIHIENAQAKIQGVYFRQGMKEFIHLGAQGTIDARFNVINGQGLPRESNVILTR
ncbi:MAG: glycosyl hydrolase family 28-related protein [Verrucomicrobiota bacterium]